MIHFPVVFCLQAVIITVPICTVFQFSVSIICLLVSPHCCFALQVYPGLMVTSGLVHSVMNGLNISVHIRDVCVFLAPVFRYTASYNDAKYSTVRALVQLWSNLQE